MSAARISSNPQDFREFQFDLSIPREQHQQLLLTTTALLNALEDELSGTNLKFGDRIAFYKDGVCSVPLYLKGEKRPLATIKLYCADLSIPLVVEWLFDLKSLAGEDFLRQELTLDKLNQELESLNRTAERIDGPCGKTAKLSLLIYQADLTEAGDIFHIINSVKSS